MGFDEQPDPLSDAMDLVARLKREIAKEEAKVSRLTAVGLDQTEAIRIQMDRANAKDAWIERARLYIEDMMDNDGGAGDYYQCGCYWKRFKIGGGGHKCSSIVLIEELAAF